MNKPRIAFLGLGIMGSGMARRLLVNGFPLTVFNRNPEKSRPFEAEGAHVAKSPREAAEVAEVIVCMVADDMASRAMWLGENGALAAAPRHGFDRRQHTLRELGQGTRIARRSKRLRVARCARHWHSQPGGSGTVKFFRWRRCSHVGARATG